VEVGLKNQATALVVLACLIGCATGPTYQNYQDRDAACVTGGTANLIKFFSEGEAHVFIKEIDGVPTGSREPYCVAPGKHQLGVSAYNNYQTAQDYVDLDFVAMKKYRLRANLRGISFVFQLVDVTNPPETTVAEFSLKVGSVSQPTYIPIIVPVK
jgi:hypothetical protein